ncbi:MAG: hypothetical protein QM772_15025 [Ottowia sp.]|uniref:hypothetical protein n=1 Tax=Ottowia sp. TaxID=1898956 RepID=UPI0039E4EED0
MSTQFISIDSSFDSSLRHAGVARAERGIAYLHELGSSLAQVFSAGLAQGWQAMCRRAAEAHGANPVQGFQALCSRSAEAREDARFFATAKRDPRVMHELQVAISRHGGA